MIPIVCHALKIFSFAVCALLLIGIPRTVNLIYKWSIVRRSRVPTQKTIQIVYWIVCIACSHTISTRF